MLKKSICYAFYQPACLFLFQFTRILFFITIFTGIFIFINFDKLLSSSENIQYIMSLFGIYADKQGIFRSIELFRAYYYCKYFFIFLLKLIIVSSMIYFMVYAFKNNLKAPIFIISILFLFVVILYGYTKTNKLHIFLLPLPVILLWVVFMLNKVDFEKLDLIMARSRIINILFTVFMIIPGIFEIFFPSFILYIFKNSKLHIFNITVKSRRRHIADILSLSVGGSIIIACTMPLIVGQGFFETKRDDKISTLEVGCFYSLEVDETTHRLFACKMDGAELMIFDVSNLDKKPLVKPMLNTELQDLLINEKRRELYHASRYDSRLHVFNLDTLEKVNVSNELFGNGSRRVEYNEKSKTIIVTAEDDYAWVLDADTLDPITVTSFRSPETVWTNEYIDSDPDEPVYYLTHYRGYNYSIVYNVKENQVQDFQTGLYQGAIEISSKKNELYIALPLKSEILVLDRETLRKKNVIPTVFGVRNIKLDEKNNTLFAGSMCNGFVDVIELGQPNKHKKVFVDYYIREIEIYPPTRSAFISSYFGLYHFKY